jgi:hypothetical protein
MDLVSRIVDAIKLIVSLRIAVAVFLTTGILLLFGKYFPFLEYIIQTYQPIKVISLILFIFSSTYILVNIATSIINYMKTVIKKNINRWILKIRIYSLNESEKAILREFFMQNVDEIKLPINNPDVARLIRKGILSVPIQHGYVKILPVGIIRYVEISYYSRELLSSRLIGWPEGKPTEEEKDFIRKNRPQFMKIILSEFPVRDWWE